jgi:hypothetical protein
MGMRTARDPRSRDMDNGLIARIGSADKCTIKALMDHFPANPHWTPSGRPPNPGWLGHARRPDLARRGDRRPLFAGGWRPDRDGGAPPAPNAPFNPGN